MDDTVAIAAHQTWMQCGDIRIRVDRDRFMLSHRYGAGEAIVEKVYVPACYVPV
ncbi:MAG: hypothetical protein MUF23_13365 [Pirellula sp.]|nr:hypothetical protein [Pirellula sp.]